MKATFTIKCAACGALNQVSRSMRGPIVDSRQNCSCACGHNYDSREFVPGSAKLEEVQMSDSQFVQAMEDWDEAAEAEFEFEEEEE